MFQFRLLKIISFWGFFLVSIFLSVTLFYGLAVDTLSKVIMVTVSLSLEALKVLVLVMANTSKMTKYQLLTNSANLVDHRYEIRTINKNIISNYIIYFLAASLSISASFGFILKTIDTKLQTLEVVSTSLSQNEISSQIELKQQGIDQNSKLIDLYNKQILLLKVDSPNYLRDLEGINRKISTTLELNSQLLLSRQKLTTELFALQELDHSQAKKTEKSMYILMAEVVGVDQKLIMLILLGAISLLIEIGIYICSPHMNSHQEKTGTKTLKVNKLLENLFYESKKGDKGYELMSIEKSANVSNISIEDAARFFKWLVSIKSGNNSIFSYDTNSGKWYSSLSLEDIKKIVQEYHFKRA